MVQRKAPTKLEPQAETWNKPRPCHHQHDRRTKGGDDLKSRMKKLRSIKASDLASLEDSSSGHQFHPPKMKTLMRSPNYMKPTTSWDARRSEQTQVPNSNKSSNHPKPPKIRRTSMKGEEVIMNRATCSSILKDSKFPKALDLNSGGTEAEGTSVMKVCPYTYCSLNGHRHEALPPLKCFMATRRKLIKTQKSLKLKGLPFFKAKDGKGVDDTGQKASVIEEDDDFFVEVYANSYAQVAENPHVFDGSSVIQDGGKTSERVVEEGSEESDASMSFLEFVECDQQTESEDEYFPEFDASVKDEVFSGSKVTLSTSETDDTGSEEEHQPSKYVEDDLSFDTNTTSDICEISDVDMDQSIEEHDQAFEEDDNSEINNHKGMPEIYVSVICDRETNDLFIDDGNQNPKGLVPETSEENLQCGELPTKSSDPDDVDCEQDCTDLVKTNSDESLIEAVDSRKTGTRNARKRTTQESDQVKEFNPRSPHFLPIEPDPETEKVDLRHQMTDERRNSEDWMLDYALQRAVSKLAPARKRKVALLVEAFETVKPLTVFHQPLRNASSSGFTHARPIQACS